MSIDLDWASLSSSLSDTLVTLLNKHLSSATRPSFIGPVQITSCSFGTHSPDVELVDLRDIYRDFLEDDESTSHSAGYNEHDELYEDGQEFEWVTRKEGARGGGVMENNATDYSHLPPHVRYAHTPLSESGLPDMGVYSPGLGHGGSWGNGSTASLPGLQLPNSRPFHPLSQSTPSLARQPPSLHVPTPPRDHPSILSTSASPQPDPTPLPAPVPALDTQNDIQLHFRITHASDLRVSLCTSLQINYPSPMFMALPIKLAITGLVFQGEIIVAYEGSRKRVHLCIVDDADPYGLSTPRTNPVSGESDTPPTEGEDVYYNSRNKPNLAVGLRILPSIFIESEIGQADKHILKNVSRVERFIQDVIRKTVEDELVFPNFHTLILGE